MTVVLGVTGGIASGKSTVTGLLRALGAAVVSADELARQAVLPGSRVLDRLAARFGRRVLTAEGRLDRPVLADIVFGDEQARKDLNAIMHPAIAELAEKALARLRGEGAPLVIYEAPLLFEAGAEGRVDAVLVVTVGEATQLRRLMERDGLGEAAAKARIAAQMSEEEKVARADYVIDNSGDLESTRGQVQRLFPRLTGSPADPAPDG